jgi:hypothetical protein
VAAGTNFIYATRKGSFRQARTWIQLADDLGEAQHSSIKKKPSPLSKQASGCRWNRKTSSIVFLIMRPALAIAVVLIFIAFAASLSIDAWVALNNEEATADNYLAVILGVLFSLSLGAGLLGLVLYSSRHGYDDPPNRPRSLSSGAKWPI